MLEAEVVHRLKAHLEAFGFDGEPASDVVVDADSSYSQSRFARALQPMAVVPIGGYRPDLLCHRTTPRTRLVVGFEVKASMAGWRQGITQARMYRRGVHQSFLALPADGGPKDRQALTGDARRSGVGLMLLDRGRWHQEVEPDEPTPTPWDVTETATALQGLPALKRLTLNFPVHYLSLPALRVLWPGMSSVEALRRAGGTLRTDSSRIAAARGAQALGLLDVNDRLTPRGRVAADLFLALGYEPGHAFDPRRRLADDPRGRGFAAVARSVFLQLPAAQLIVETLRGARGHRLATVELHAAARLRNRPLADALFLLDPGRDLPSPAPSGAFSGSTPQALRQCLYHAGIVATRMHPSAGGRSDAYLAHEDVWELDERFVPEG